MVSPFLPKEIGSCVIIELGLHLAEKLLAFLSHDYAGISCPSFDSPRPVNRKWCCIWEASGNFVAVVVYLFMLVCSNKPLKGNERRDSAERRENCVRVKNHAACFPMQITELQTTQFPSF